MGDTVGIIFIGDIIGSPGRLALRQALPGLVRKYAPDIVIANGENSAGGFGITPDIAGELKSLGVDVITSGNHIWDRKEILEHIRTDKRLLRPENYPQGAPGRGTIVFECPSGAKVGVLNLAGRVFMDDLDCPFRVGMEAIKGIREITNCIVVDMHAETTSEKGAMACYLDGIASAVIGTHTHIQTSDERILPGGTAFITDSGMTGPVESVIGMKTEAIIQRFLTQMPTRFDVAAGPLEVQGAYISVSARDGRARGIERIKLKV
jgi:metallophosphoesterase (TIGR00282 family)